MPQVQIPGVGLVDFPDTMSADDINTAAKRLHDEAQPHLQKPSSSNEIPPAVENLAPAVLTKGAISAVQRGIPLLDNMVMNAGGKIGQGLGVAGARLASAGIGSKILGIPGAIMGAASPALDEAGKRAMTSLASIHPMNAVEHAIDKAQHLLPTEHLSEGVSDVVQNAADEAAKVAQTRAMTHASRLATIGKVLAPINTLGNAYLGAEALNAAQPYIPTPAGMARPSDTELNKSIPQRIGEKEAASQQLQMDASSGTRALINMLLRETPRRR